MANDQTFRSFQTGLLTFLCVFLFLFQIVYSAQVLEQEVVETLRPKLSSDRITYFFGNYGVDQIPLSSGATAIIRGFGCSDSAISAGILNFVDF